MSTCCCCVCMFVCLIMSYHHTFQINVLLSSHRWRKTAAGMIVKILKNDYNGSSSLEEKKNWWKKTCFVQCHSHPILSLVVPSPELILVFLCIYLLFFAQKKASQLFFRILFLFLFFKSLLWSAIFQKRRAQRSAPAAAVGVLKNTHLAC